MEPFIALMRRYCIDYVARHDFDMLDQLMEPDYTLRMGDHELVGRDTQYADATRIQMTRLPNLQLTPHEFITNGDRLAMRFSEHGAAPDQGGALASWGGISLYRWNGTRLTVCEVEQDYHARRRQYVTCRPDPVDAPAIAPWDTVAEPSDPAAEAAARSWLKQGAAPIPGVSFDDDRLPGIPRQRVLEPASVQILDLFSAGDRVAFHAVQTGTLLDDFGVGSPGEKVHLHLAGIVATAAGAVVEGHIIRDRIGLDRRLRGRTVTIA